MLGYLLEGCLVSKYMNEVTEHLSYLRAVQVDPCPNIDKDVVTQQKIGSGKSNYEALPLHANLGICLSLRT